MWKVPPLGVRRIRAEVTWLVIDSTSSRMRADAAACPPCTAMKALVTAMAILFGAKPTTAPLRRMIL